MNFAINSNKYLKLKSQSSSHEAVYQKYVIAITSQKYSLQSMTQDSDHDLPHY